MRIVRFTGLALVWALGTTMHAQTYKVMDYFNGTPSAPSSVIAQSRGGYLVTTAVDAAPFDGVAFRVATSGTLTVLHQFSSSGGNYPNGLTLGGTACSMEPTKSEGPPTGALCFR